MWVNSFALVSWVTYERNALALVVRATMRLSVLNGATEQGLNGQRVVQPVLELKSVSISLDNEKKRYTSLDR